MIVLCVSAFTVYTKAKIIFLLTVRMYVCMYFTYFKRFLQVLLVVKLDMNVWMMSMHWLERKPTGVLWLPHVPAELRPFHFAVFLSSALICLQVVATFI